LDKDLEGLPETLLEKFEKTLIQVIEAIQNILQQNLMGEKNDNEKTGYFHSSSVDEHQLRKQMEDLGAALEDDMARAMELLVDLKKGVGDSDLLGLLEQIEINLKSYDCNKAFENFDKVMEWLNNEKLKGKIRKTKRILIVDDEPTNIDILMGLLKSKYKLVAALSGEKALEIAKSRTSPDLILLDIMMPGMNGYQVCEALKSSEVTKNIPVIFVTAVSEIMDKTKGFDLGAVDYITKPFHPPGVLARVKAHLKLKDRSDKWEQLAVIDGLTKINNRRRFDEMLNLEWKRSLRSRAPLSLIMIDIDFFKSFNDRYGHAIGDQCLKGVASRLRDCLERPADIITRYGGEEFAALLPDTDREGAEKMANKMRKEVETLQIPPTEANVTISLGVVTAFSDTGIDSPEALLKAADTALYESKKSGRNKVTSHKLSGVQAA
jgi:diguanylate cyclase (GGDEF)-like protein